MKVEIAELNTGAEYRRLLHVGFIEENGFLYRRLGAGCVKKVLSAVRTACDLNADTGVLTAIDTACEFYGYDCADKQKNEIAGFIICK